jgi:hypothetical protein
MKASPLNDSRHIRVNPPVINCFLDIVTDAADIRKNIDIHLEPMADLALRVADAVAGVKRHP